MFVYGSTAKSPVKDGMACHYALAAALIPKALRNTRTQNTGTWHITHHTPPAAAPDSLMGIREHYCKFGHATSTAAPAR